MKPVTRSSMKLFVATILLITDVACGRQKSCFDQSDCDLKNGKSCINGKCVDDPLFVKSPRSNRNYAKKCIFHQQCEPDELCLTQAYEHNGMGHCMKRPKPKIEDYGVYNSELYDYDSELYNDYVYK